jgi:DNA gyrase/topoisomerase IV subunit A
MFSSEKIEEWLQEIEQRPASANLIVQFIANRLNELSTWNENLRAENIALRTGQRVQEYEQEINHLKYQLELLKRQVGGEIPDGQPVQASQTPVERKNLLVYDSFGRILRLEMGSKLPDEKETIAELKGIPLTEEPLRLLTVASNEEILCVFTSGRFVPLSVNAIPQVEKDAEWNQVTIPNEPNVGDALACLVPFSKIALADFFIQISRRGFMKKIRKALAPSIMENRYIGTGTKIPGDQTLDLGLGYDHEQYALVSWEGYLQCVTAEMLSFAVEEAIRLNSTDHLVAAFPYKSDQSILLMTQIGKIIHRTADSLEMAEALKRRGKMLYSKARREKGVRIVGGAAVNENDIGVALHQNGSITFHPIARLVESGTIHVEVEILAFTIFQDS